MEDLVVVAVYNLSWLVEEGYYELGLPCQSTSPFCLPVNFNFEQLNFEAIFAILWNLKTKILWDFQKIC